MKETQTQPVRPATLELGGHRWRPIQQPTLEHAIWMDKHVLEAGLHKLTQAPEETEEQFAARIWELIARSDKVFLFLGGMLLPDELPDDAWTPEEAQRTAARFKKISAPAEMAGLRTHLVALVLYFFVKGLGSLQPTGIASGAKPAALSESITPA